MTAMTTARADILPQIPALRAFAPSLCHSPDRADDLVQDTLLRAWTNFSSYRPGTRLRSWLFTILRNGFYSDLRKQRREVTDPEGDFVAHLAVNPAHDGPWPSANSCALLPTCRPSIAWC